MGKDIGYKNLELGRGWNKGQHDKSKALICCVCGKEFYRCDSQIKSKNPFCSPECKAKGMTLKLTKSMRLGTGCSAQVRYYKRKYYKYKKWDIDRGVLIPDYSVWDLVNRLKEGECFYCGSHEDLGLDKIDNNGGHNFKNTVVSCELCNMTRGARFTVDEMKKIGEVIRVIRESRKSGG